jgi:hypothetical protein
MLLSLVPAEAGAEFKKTKNKERDRSDGLISTPEVRQERSD